MCIFAFLVLFLPAIDCPFYEWRWSGGRSIDRRLPESDIAKVPYWISIGTVASQNKDTERGRDHLQLSTTICRDVCSQDLRSSLRE
jgi:hypothetical protein